jgi:hypothetical protein
MEMESEKEKVRVKEWNYRPEEILLIEMAGRMVLNDALGRYIHDPSNLRNIQTILLNGSQDLRTILPTRLAMGPKPKEDPCPSGYTHLDCACVADIGTGKTGTTSG